MSKKAEKEIMKMKILVHRGMCPSPTENRFCTSENYYELHGYTCYKIFVNFMEIRYHLKI